MVAVPLAVFALHVGQTRTFRDCIPDSGDGRLLPGMEKQHRSQIGGALLGATALAWISDALMVGTAGPQGQRFTGEISIGLLAAGGVCLFGALVAFEVVPAPSLRSSRRKIRKAAWYGGEYLHGRRPSAPSSEAIAGVLGELAQLTRSVEERTRNLGRPAPKSQPTSPPQAVAPATIRAIRAEVLENLQAVTKYVDVLNQTEENFGVQYAAGFRFKAAVWTALQAELARDAQLFETTAAAYREADRANQSIAWRETHAQGGLFGVNRKEDDLPAVQAAFRTAATALGDALPEKVESAEASERQPSEVMARRTEIIVERLGDDQKRRIRSGELLERGFALKAELVPTGIADISEAIRKQIVAGELKDRLLRWMIESRGFIYANSYGDSGLISQERENELMADYTRESVTEALDSHLAVLKRTKDSIPATRLG
jgi:hypothetical protein